LLLRYYNKNMNKDCLVIGLTGSFGAGCTTTSNLLKSEKNFIVFSLSKLLKREARKEIKDLKSKDNKEQREILQNLGDKLRKKSATALVLPIIKKIKESKYKNVVIECIRNPEEIRVLKEAFPNFFLLAIDAEEDVRWIRLKNIYNNDKDAFKVNDKRDSGKGQPSYGQKVKDCIELADILINNNVSFYKKAPAKDFKNIHGYGQKLFGYIHLLVKAGSRKPNLDELYMHHACSVALRSYCSRRQVGAVIVKEDGAGSLKESYVIATGCNNVPIGEAACEVEYKKNSKKCYRDKTKEDHFKEYKYCRSCGEVLKDGLTCSKCGEDNTELPGKLLDVCRAVHAEEAAILQAAKLGSTSLNNSKLYSSAFPCMLCCKKIINSGIKKVVYFESYPMQGSLAIQMFEKCGVEISKFEGVNSGAFNRLFKKH